MRPDLGLKIEEVILNGDVCSHSGEIWGFTQTDSVQDSFYAINSVQASFEIGFKRKTNSRNCSTPVRCAQ